MPFDIKNEKKTARFFWDSERTEWIDLRIMTAGKLKELRKKYIKKNVEYYRPEGSTEQPYRYEVQDLDEDGFTAEFWDHQICGWNFKDLDGKPIPCDLENKMLLLSNSNEFASWAMQCMKKLDADEKKRVEDAEKN